MALNAVRTSKVSQTQHQHREQRCTKRTMASLRFSNCGGKTKFQILFKILAFLVHGNNRNGSIMILWRHNMFLPDCWLQFHNNNNLLVSKTTTVLKQDRRSALIDTSDIALVVYFTSEFDNRRARLWMIQIGLYNGGLTMERRICSSGCYFGCIHCQSYFATYCDIWIGNSNAIICTSKLRYAQQTSFSEKQAQCDNQILRFWTYCKC